MPSDPPSDPQTPAVDASAAVSPEGSTFSDAQLLAASNVLDALLAADAKAQDPALVLAAHEAARVAMRAEESAAAQRQAPPSEPAGPVAPAKEWAAAIVLMIVFASLGASFIVFLRR